MIVSLKLDNKYYFDRNGEFKVRKLVVSKSRSSVPTFRPF